jgi:predicted RNA methylase
MELSKKSRDELLTICKEKKIKGFSGKNKEDMLKLLTITDEDSNKLLLTTILEKHSLKVTANLLHLAVGTVQRWLDLKNIPPQYKFDLLRLSGKTINPQEYKSSEKDQFFTPEPIVHKCWNIFRAKVPLTDINLQDYTFIEPSAGDGAFLKVLPPTRTIALDIEPRHANVQKQDYLLWEPENVNANANANAIATAKYIVFGNPPFGLRGHTALNFIQHSRKFADYVCFILPQLFESDGKGSPRKRIKGYNLIHSEKIMAEFYTPEKTNVNVNGVFQIWSKHTSNPLYNITEIGNTAEEFKIYSLSDGGSVSSTRNKKMLDKCDIYIPSTCFGKDHMRLYNSFEELPGRKGYGIVFLKNKAERKEKSKTIDWHTDGAYLSTNSAYNLRKSIIIGKLNEIL